MVTRDEIVAKAREYIGTPYHHQGRLKGIGVDCGLIACVALDLGIPHEDRTDYQEPPPSGLLLEMLAKNLDQVPLEDALPGDVIAIWKYRKHIVQHCGIRTPTGIVHVRYRRSVVEQRLSGSFAEQQHSCWRYRGLA